MRRYTKEVGTLRRVIFNLLSPADCRDIFGKVLDLFDAQLADSFAKVEKTSEAADWGAAAAGTAAHIRSDGALLMETLGSLADGGEVGSCRLTVSKPELKAPTVSALEAEL